MPRAAVSVCDVTFESPAVRGVAAIAVTTPVPSLAAAFAAKTSAEAVASPLTASRIEAAVLVIAPAPDVARLTVIARVDTDTLRDCEFAAGSTYRTVIELPRLPGRRAVSVRSLFAPARAV